MDYNSLSDQERKLSIIKALVKLAFADGKVDVNEVSYLHKACHSLGLSIDVLQQLGEEIADENLAIPDSEQERMQIFYYLLFLLKADHVITQEEQSMLYQIGAELGLREDFIRDMLNVVYANVDKDIPPHLLLDVIRKYGN